VDKLRSLSFSLVESHSRAAVTISQADACQRVLDAPALTGFAFTKFDHRYNPPRQHRAVECEALKQHVIVNIVRDQLNALLPEPLEDVLT